MTGFCLQAVPLQALFSSRNDGPSLAGTERMNRREGQRARPSLSTFWIRTGGLGLVECSGTALTGLQCPSCAHPAQREPRKPHRASGERWRHGSMLRSCC